MKIWCSKKSEETPERPRLPRDIFDWNTVPSPDPDELTGWIGATDAKDRQFPLQLARQVHDELEWKLMGPQKLDTLELSQIRGGLKALARFAQVYDAVLKGKVK